MSSYFIVQYLLTDIRGIRSILVALELPQCYNEINTEL